MRLVDLTPKIFPDMVQNHSLHPPTGHVFVNQRHDITQFWFARYWTAGLPPLLDDLPESARTAGAGHGWQTEHLVIGSHSGAHIDAPVHYDPESQTDVAQIPLETCYGRAVLLDLKDYCDDESDITADDLSAAEERAGVRVRPGDILLVNTGHAERYAYPPEPDPVRYREHYPGFDHYTVKWIIDREVKLVGTDTVSPDRHMQCSTHVNLLMRERVGKEAILILENLVHLEQIPTPEFTFIGFPLPIVNASGSPIRAVALVEP
jgi:kynurenine formamidase